MAKVHFALIKISKEFSKYPYFLFGLALAVSGTHLSKLLTGIPVVWLSLWILNYGLQTSGFYTLSYFNKRKEAFLLPLIFLIHIISLFFSSNKLDGLSDLKVKLVLMVYSLAIGLAPMLNKNQFKRILLVFYAALFFGTLVSLCKYFGILGFKLINTRQEMAFAISHITYSILFCIAVSAICWQMFFADFQFNRNFRLLHLFFLIWFLLFIFLLQTFTSIVMLVFLSLFWILVAVLKTKNRQRKIVFIFIFSLLVLFPFLFLQYTISKFYNIDKINRNTIQLKTAQSNSYSHIFENPHIENGHYVGLFYCEVELNKAWPKRSKIYLDSLDPRGSRIRFTLIHYLSSLNLPKDSFGVAQLSLEDVNNIEKGFSNYIYKNKWSLYPRMYEIVKEFHLYQLGYPCEGHSVIQRIKLVHIAWKLFKYQYFWYGTSIGDLKDCYQKYYTQYEPNLAPEYRLRAHNQYVTYLLCFGIIIGICVLFVFVVPLLWRINRQNTLWLSVLMLILLSFTNEDMLETQAGTAIVGLFYPLFLFQNRDENKIE